MKEIDFWNANAISVSMITMVSERMFGILLLLWFLDYFSLLKTEVDQEEIIVESSKTRQANLLK